MPSTMKEYMKRALDECKNLDEAKRLKVGDNVKIKTKMYGLKSNIGTITDVDDMFIMVMVKRTDGTEREIELYPNEVEKVNKSNNKDVNRIDIKDDIKGIKGWLDTLLTAYEFGNIALSKNMINNIEKKIKELRKKL